MTTTNPISAGAPATSSGLHENAHDEIEAFGPWVTVTRKLAGETSKGGVILPDTVRSRMEAEYVGTVVDIGWDAGQKKLGRGGRTLQIGDRIIYIRCFPMAKQGAKDEIYSMVHIDNIMGSPRSPSAVPAMAPENEKFRQD
jgi:co-chaperonin GroES (HSP10)